MEADVLGQYRACEVGFRTQYRDLKTIMGTPTLPILSLYIYS